MSYSDKLLLLHEEIQHLQAAQQHLIFSLGRTKDRLDCNPETLTPEELERFESLTSRFARLADVLTQRVMRLIDDIELVPPGTMLDRINRAEKRGWVEQAHVLIQIRELRNLIAHEYAADEMAEIYQAIHLLAPTLSLITQRTSDYAAALLTRVQAFQ